jgi:hypothetical protein
VQGCDIGSVRWQQVLPGPLLHLEIGCLPPLIGITKVFPHRWFTFTSQSSRTGRTKQWKQPNQTKPNQTIPYQTKPAGDHLERFCKTRYLNHHTNLTGYALENVSYGGCILPSEWATRVAADSAIWDCLKTCQLGRYVSWNRAKYKVSPAHYSPKSEPPPPPPLSISWNRDGGWMGHPFPLGSPYLKLTTIVASLY